MNLWSKAYLKRGAKAPDSEFRAEPPTFAERPMSKYKLHELLAALQQDIDRLEEGDLHLSELQTATDHARTLYEHLMVLNYLAQERLVKGESDSGKIPFRLNAIHPGQTSLIDAIEEISSIDHRGEGQPQEPRERATPDEIKVKESKEQNTIGPSSLKFGAPSHEEQKEKDDTSGKVSKKSNPPSEKEAKTVEVNEVQPSKKSMPESDDSSLADKLRRTPVEDLRRAISLNQKFQFIKSFFEGDSANYDRFIDELNGSADFKEARAKVEVQVPQIEKKAEEDEVAAGFLNLIERRFL